MANLNTTFQNPATNYLIVLPKESNVGAPVFSSNTAGSLMKTEFTAIRPNLAAGDVIKVLHRMTDRSHKKGRRMFYVYVTDEDNRLMGVFSLNNLISACPGTVVSDFMKHEVISVNPEDDQGTLAQIVAKHNLMAVPVVDEQKRLLGIVTADDALDKIIPTDWKKRLPRFYR